MQQESRIDPVAAAALGTIPGITQDLVRSWLRIARPVSSLEAVRAEILGYVNVGQQDVHPYGIKVLSIFHIARKNDIEFQHRYNIASDSEYSRMMLWHGTTIDVIPKILKEGLQLPPFKNQMFGPAIYLSDRTSKSANYCDPRMRPRVGSTGYIFLCDVMLGKSYSATEAHNKWNSPPSGFDSVRCAGKRIPDPDGDVILMGSVMPKGKTIDNTKYPHYPIIHNEYAVYSPDKVKPTYLLKIEFTSSKFTNV